MGEKMLAAIQSTCKEHLGKLASAGVSIAFFVATLLVNVSSHNTHVADMQAQQEKRITALEDAVKNDLATRRELGQFKDDATSRLNRIEDKLDRELEFHTKQHLR